MRINETCYCGGKIEAESQDAKTVERVVEKWRRRHSHFTRPERPVQYWPTQPYTVTWNSSNTGTTSAVTRSTTHDKG